MTKPRIEYQTIMKNGKPVFAIVSYSDFLKIYPVAGIPVSDIVYNHIPHQIMRLVINKGLSRIRAWREYLNLTQKEVANKMGITQAALSQIEIPNAKIRRVTLEKIAKALGITIDQLR